MYEKNLIVSALFALLIGLSGWARADEKPSPAPAAGHHCPHAAQAGDCPCKHDDCRHAKEGGKPDCPYAKGEDCPCAKEGSKADCPYAKGKDCPCAKGEGKADCPCAKEGKGCKCAHCKHGKASDEKPEKASTLPKKK